MEHRIRGGVVLLDDGDAWILEASKWRIGNRGYVMGWMPGGRRGDGRWVSMHRALFCFPYYQLDHVNGVRHDNRRCNLRHCTQTQNLFNRHVAFGRVPFKGVREVATGFQARITVDKKTKSLGVYRTPEDAAIAYDRAALSYFGRFACTNKHLGLLAS